MSGSEGSNIPEVVKKQAERADQIHRQAYPDQYPQEAKEEKPEEGNTPPEGAAPKPEETPKPEEKPKEEAPKVAPEPVAPKPPEKPPEEDWKHKYDVLLGKYNAEVPKLHTQVAAMQNLTRELQSQVTGLKAAAKEKPATAKETPPKEEPPKKSEPAPQEIEVVKTFKEEYPDIYEAVARMIESAHAEKDAGNPPKPEEKPKAEERPKPETPSPTPPPAATDPRATFDYYLNRDVPDWPQLNKDPEFIMFLQAPDPNYAGTKLQSIQAAYDACDFTTVIGHFRDFKETRKSAAPSGATPPQNPSSQPNQPNPKPEGEKPPEEKFLAPPKGGRGGAPPSGTPFVTPGDLTKFYDEARRGMWGPIDGEKFRKEEARLLSALTGTKT
jgi:hypothetical protein